MSKVLSVSIGVLLAVVAGLLAQAETARDYAVEVSANVQSSPARITLNWGESCPNCASAYTLRRKSQRDTSWGPEVALPGTATKYLDSNVRIGRAYEYQVTKVTPLEALAIHCAFSLCRETKRVTHAAIS
jgi:hypothetical protein